MRARLKYGRRRFDQGLCVTHGTGLYRAADRKQPIDGAFFSNEDQTDSQEQPAIGSIIDPGEPVADDHGDVL